MGLFDKIREPVFLKEDSSAETQLLAFQELAKTATGALAERLEQEIKCVEAGIFGENAIKYELRNSHIPMYVLHDLYLEYEGLSAQIDYLIVTRKHQYTVECKNLYGDIEITNTGDFVRTVSFSRYKKKEGIYSPITQNQRHLELIKQIRRAERNNLLTKALFESNFYNNYRFHRGFGKSKDSFRTLNMQRKKSRIKSYAPISCRRISGGRMPIQRRSIPVKRKWKLWHGISSTFTNRRR